MDIENFSLRIKAIINQNLYKKGFIDENTFLQVNDILLKKIEFSSHGEERQHEI